MSNANIHFIFFPFELENWGSVNGGKLDFFPQFIDWPNRSIEFWKRIDRVLEINLKIKSSFFCIDLTHTFGFTLQFNKNNLKATNFIIQTWYASEGQEEKDDVNLNTFSLQNL